MMTSVEEYNSLRQEILDHQKNRLTVLNIVLPVTAALIAAGVQFNNPYLLLIPPFLLLGARVLLVNIHAGIQRISAFIRIILEVDDPELKWEAASHFLRSESIKQGAAVKNISSLKPYDNLLAWSAAASILLAVVISILNSAHWGLLTIVLVLIISCGWYFGWMYYGDYHVRGWEDMSLDELEAKKLIEFKKSLPKKRSVRK